MTDRDKSERIYEEIREILLNSWDPIGIKNEPRARDEYDSYIGGIYKLLKNGSSDEEIASYLWRVIEDRIQVHPARGATEKTVKELRRIKLG
jgi:hypothetical protein